MITSVTISVCCMNLPRSKERGFIEALPALIKRGRAVVLPRSKERGFIEAERPGVGAVAGTVLPRSKERGFIEAIVPQLGLDFCFRAFRARKSAASLKPHPSVSASAKSIDLPRSKERGFIEA